MGSLIVLAAALLVASDCGGDYDDVTFTASHDSLEPGARITYTITINLDDHSDDEPTTHSVRVRVTLDSRTSLVTAPVVNAAADEIAVAQDAPTVLAADWQVTTDGVQATVLAPPNGAKLTLIAEVNADPTGKDIIAEVELPDRNNNHGEDEETVWISVVDLRLASAVTDAPGPLSELKPGDTLTYTHTLTNASANEAKTTLTNVVPAGTTFVALGSDSLWTCSDGAPAGTTCTRAVTIPAGALGTAQLALLIPFVVKIDASHPPGTPIVNDASLPNVSNVSNVGTIVAGDPKPGNNRTQTETAFQPIDVAGDWNVSITVTQAQPGCDAELGVPRILTMTIVQNGPSVMVSGLGGLAEPWTGSVAGARVLFGGQRIEFGGLSTTQFDLLLDPSGLLVGAEAWTWVGGTQACDDARSTVIAERVPLGPVVQEIFAVPGGIPSSTRSPGLGDQAAGPPDTVGCGDLPTAWTPNFDGSSFEYLEALFAPLNFHATAIEVYETNSTGFITAIDLVDSLGVYHRVFDATITGPDTTPCPGVFRVDFPQTTHDVAKAWIYTDSLGWEQIDAVKLIGVIVAP